MTPHLAQNKPLEVRNLELWFPGGKAPALMKVNIDLLPGTVTAIVGPAGVGKSTLFKAILNEIAISKGSIKVDGVEVVNGKALDPELYSYVPQKTNLMGGLTVWETLELAAYARLKKGRDAKERFRAVMEVLNQLNMDHKRDSYVRDLSGGEERRVSIALELISSPRLLLLDEPGSGLDEGLDKDLHLLIRRVADGDRKPAVLFVTHSTNHLEKVDPDTGRPLVDNIIAIGKAAADSPTAIVRYNGRPGQILANFRAGGYSDVMDALRADPLHPITISTSRPDFSFKPSHKTKSWFRSLAYSIKRQWLVIGGAKGFAKSIFMRLLLGLCIALALWPVSKIGLGLNIGTINQEFLTYASTLVILLAVLGTAMPVMGIVNHWDVIRREQRWGISGRSYVWAQMFIQFFQIVPVVAAATVLSLVLSDKPTDETLLPQVRPYPEYWQLFLLLLLSTMAAYSIGVLIGCRNTSTYNANLATTLAFAVMLVGNGLVIAWPTIAPVFYSSFIIPSRSGIAMIASNFNAEQVMGAVNDDAFNLATNELHMLMLFVASVTVVVLLFANYSVKRSLGQIGTGASKATAVTGQNSAHEVPAGAIQPRINKSVAAIMLVGVVIAATFYQYYTQDGESETTGLTPVAAQPTASAPESGVSQTTNSQTDNQAPIQPEQDANNPEPPPQADLAPPTASTDDQSTDQTPSNDDPPDEEISPDDQNSDDPADGSTEPDPVATAGDDAASAQSEADSPAEEDASSDDQVAASDEPETAARAEESGTSRLALNQLPDNAVYFDVGGETEPPSLSGFAVAAEDVSDQGDDWACTLGGFTDSTKKDQQVVSSGSSWAVVPVTVNSQEHTVVSFCVEKDETIDDYWELWLGGDRPELKACTEMLLSRPADLTPGMNILTFEIPAECIPSGQINLVFTGHNNDGAGIWGILIEQESAIDTGDDDVATSDEPAAAENQPDTGEESADEDALIAGEVGDETTEDTSTSADTDPLVETTAEESFEEINTEDSAEAQIQPAIEPVSKVEDEESPYEVASDETDDSSGQWQDSQESSQIEDVVVSDDESAPVAEETVAGEIATEEVPSDEATNEISTDDISTEEPTEEVLTEEPTAEPTEEPVPTMAPDATYIDIGGNNEPADLSGFSRDIDDLSDQGDPWSCKLGGFRDYTKRDQNRQERDEDVVSLPIKVNRLQQTTISFCIEESEDNGYDWELQLGGDRPQDAHCDTISLSKPSHLSPGLNVVTWTIPPECIPSDEVVLEFIDQNQDGAGIWGVLVEQDPGITADPPAEPAIESCIGYAPDGRCFTESAEFTQEYVHLHGLPAHEWDHCWVDEQPDPANNIHICVVWGD